MKFVSVILTVALVLLSAASLYAQSSEESSKEIAILVLSDSGRGLASEGTLSTIDPTFRKKMESQGYTLNIYGSGYQTVANGGIDLNQFNEIILYYPPVQGDARVRKLFERSMTPIYDFVKKGGGLFIFCDEAYDSYISQNVVLKDIGAEILPECVVDDEEVFRQAGYFQEYFCSTINIADHSLTQGVKKLVYPLAWSPASGRGSFTMKLDDSWQTVIKGNKNAYSISAKPDEIGKKTYTSEPPVLAVKILGSGRIVLFPTRCLNYLHQGYHMVYEGICLDKGDGYRLMVNILDWLAEPSIASGALGGYVEERKPVEQKEKLTKEYFDSLEDVYPAMIRGGSRPFKSNITHQPDNRNDYIGIIGVYTTYSKGYGTVKEFCDKARANRYDYIVFTDAFESMNEEKWNSLTADCKANSDENFIAIPGIEIKDVHEQPSILFDMAHWVEDKWLDDSGKYLKDHPGLYFGIGHATAFWAPKGILNPKDSFLPPWFNKFYSCYEIYSYFRGDRLIGDALDWYLEVQSSDYNVIPMTSHRIYTPQDIDKITGFKTHVRTNNLDDIGSQFSYHWYVPRNVYISEGPRLNEFALENGRGAYREELWKMYIDITSDAPLKDLIVYDRKNIFQHFYPNTEHFSTEIIGYHDKQRHLTLIATDANGKRLISPTLYTSDKRQSSYMCCDLQNTLNAMYNLDSTGKTTFYGVQGNYVQGWGGLALGLLYPSMEMLPKAGIEYGYGGWNGSATHNIPHMEYAIAQRDMVYDSGDCNILNNLQYSTFLPFKGGTITSTTYADSLARYISFTPRPYSLNPMIIEQTTTFKKDVTLPDVTGPELTVLEATLAQESFPNYTLLNPGQETVTGLRSDITDKALGKLDKNGFLAAYPDFWGSFAAFSLNKDLYYALSKHNFTLGYDMPNRGIKAGDEFVSKFIVIRGEFGQKDDSEFANFYDVYGFDGTPAYSVTLEKGAILDQRFICALEASDYFVQGKITRANLPNDLGITISSLCDNWDAGMLEVDDNNLRRVGTLDGTGYIAWNINNRDRSFVIGNLVTCDDTNVRLSLIEENGAYVIYAHNPKSKDVSVTVQTPEWLKTVIPVFKKNVTLKAGQTLQMEVN